ncbi:MAG: spore maturation protein [Blautia sp.]|nr:spore maturation protein [Blautia sp.]MDY5032615.1 spore maturation protein [Blautia sp.]
MKLLTYLSDLMIPFLFLYVLGSGLWSGRNIYGDFLEGAREGLKTAAGICPTLIGLMTAVGILRASGFLDFLAGVLGNVTGRIGFPAPLVPLSLVRLFSSSAATGLLLDVFKEFGADSRMGIMAAMILSSTESVFYCMSVYFGSAKIEKTRYTLVGAILANLAGIIAAVLLVP